MKTVRVLGTRGIPARHGGFETFAECLAVYLVENGWRVVVYCQEDGSRPPWTDEWCGVERSHISTERPGSLGSIVFDWKAVLDAARHDDVCLTLGYNTAVFTALLRIRRLPNLINMDGIEWSRAKWGRAAKIWFWLNDWAGTWLGTHLVADHPEMRRLLARRTRPAKITTIPYGAERVAFASTEPLATWGLQPGRYLTLIARPEPENSILEVVQGFSVRSRGMRLAVLGHYDVRHPYHRMVLEAASEEVMFLGAIYDRPVVQALRFHCAAYVHGHQVGGTNPSLVEALGAGNAVIAHDNRFNRWVAGAGGRYFDGALGFAEVLDDVLGDPGALETMRAKSLERFTSDYSWPDILDQYETLLARFSAGRRRPSRPRRGQPGTVEQY